MKRQLLGAAALAAALGVMSRAGADVILESATLGPTGQTSGLLIGNPGHIESYDAYLGARFEVTTPVLVDYVGGHLVGRTQGNDEIFAAIVPLSGPTGLPSSPTIAPSALAATTFIPPYPSADDLVPLSVTLSPGWYGLIFGSDEFGATGFAAMPGDDSDTAQASYFLLDPFSGIWQDGGLHNARFVVTGTPLAPVPEPATWAATGLGALDLLGRARRRPPDTRPPA